MSKFVKGQKSVGRVFVKAVRPTDVDLSVHQPGQWIAGPNGKLVARLAHNGYAVPRSGGRRPKDKTVSKAALSLACNKSPRKVLSQVATKSTSQAVEDLLALIMP